jgi:formamidopyrimidine-DNA glycosylase
VGNIYADEALFQARLHPSRLGRDLKDAEADRLRRAITTVLNRAIEKRGSTIRDYVGGLGVKGGYQEEFRVYGRTAAPCSRCRTPIARIRLAGRSTHYCPRCQKEDEPQRHGGHREDKRRPRNTRKTRKKEAFD